MQSAAIGALACLFALAALSCGDPVEFTAPQAGISNPASGSTWWGPYPIDLGDVRDWTDNDHGGTPFGAGGFYYNAASFFQVNSLWPGLAPMGQSFGDFKLAQGSNFGTMLTSFYDGKYFRPFGRVYHPYTQGGSGWAPYGPQATFIDPTGTQDGLYLALGLSSSGAGIAMYSNGKTATPSIGNTELNTALSWNAMSSQVGTVLASASAVPGGGFAPPAPNPITGLTGYAINGSPSSIAWDTGNRAYYSYIDATTDAVMGVSRKVSYVVDYTAFTAWDPYQSIARLGPATSQTQMVSDGLGVTGLWSSQDYLDAGLIAAGTNHVCAITPQGLACWGSNAYGQTGTGNGATVQFPTLVNGLSAKPVNVSAGEIHTCAVTSAGSVYCWGSNDAGQIGNDTVTPANDITAPVAVTGPAGYFQGTITQVAAGGEHTCALSGNGPLATGVWCWGDDSLGQLGDFGGAYSFTAKIGSANNCLTSVTVTGSLSVGESIVDLTAPSHIPGSTVITAINAVGCGGANTVTLNNNVTVVPTETDTIVAYKSGSSSTTVAAANAGGGANCVQVASVTGIPVGAIVFDTTTPGAIPRGTTITSVGATLCGGNPGFTLSENSTHANGDSIVLGGFLATQGFLTPNAIPGPGNKSTQGYPYAFFVGLGAFQISAGLNHTCAAAFTSLSPLQTDVYCWGDNSSGQLGLGSATNPGGNDDLQDPPNSGALITAMTKVTLPADQGAIVGVSARNNTTCALASTGNVYCWGDNTLGQVNGTPGVPSNTIVSAVQKGLPFKATWLSVGDGHVCVVGSGTGFAGQVYCWGSNSSGQFGNGVTGGPAILTQAHLGNVTALTVAAGGAYTCATTFFGMAFCWGDNSNFEVNGKDYKAGPTLVTQETLPIEVAASANQALHSFWTPEALSPFQTLSTGDVKSFSAATDGQGDVVAVYLMTQPNFVSAPTGSVTTAYPIRNNNVRVYASTRGASGIWTGPTQIDDGAQFPEATTTVFQDAWARNSGVASSAAGGIEYYTPAVAYIGNGEFLAAFAMTDLVNSKSAIYVRSYSVGQGWQDNTQIFQLDSMSLNPTDTFEAFRYANELSFAGDGQGDALLTAQVVVPSGDGSNITLRNYAIKAYLYSASQGGWLNPGGYLVPNSTCRASASAPSGLPPAAPYFCWGIKPQGMIFPGPEAVVVYPAPAGTSQLLSKPDAWSLRLFSTEYHP